MLNLFGENDHYKYFGSNYGIVVFTIGFLSSIAYCILLYERIMNKEKDIYSSIIAVNDFSEKYNNLSMSELNFMPFFEIRFLKELDPKFDIFDSESGFQ